MKFRHLLLTLVFVTSCSALRLTFRRSRLLPQLIEASREAKAAQLKGGWREATCKCPMTKKVVQTAAEQANVKFEDVIQAYRKVSAYLVIF